MSKHTPGPYRIVQPMNPNRAYGIGTVPPTDDPDDDQWEVIAEICTGPTAAADASLFVASPEMLTLLDEAQEALDVLAEDVADEFPARSEAATELAMRIRAVMAKANCP